MNAENLAAAHAVERLENDIALLVNEMLELLRIAGNQRGWGELVEFTDRNLFRMIPQGARLVENAHAGRLGSLKQPGGGEKFKIEGRILAHDDRVERRQRRPLTSPLAIPVVVVRAHVHMHGFTENAADMACLRASPAQAGAFDGVDVVAMLLGGPHHGHCRIFPGFQFGERINHESQLERLAAAAEQVLLEMQLLRHGAGLTSFSGAVRSSSTAAARQASRPTTP